MLKSATLDTCWRSRPTAYFTIVRSFGTGGGVTPCAYDSLRSDKDVKERSASEPTRKAQNNSLSTCMDMDVDIFSTTTIGVSSTKIALESKPSPVNAVDDLVCVRCRHPFSPSQLVVSFMGDIFHISCFVCTECGRSVDPTSQFLLLDNGAPLCALCSPTCWACGKQITSGHVGVLNKDYHEECIKCYHCQKVFRKFSKIYASGSEPCCAECVTPVFGSDWSQNDRVEGACNEADQQKLRRTFSEPPTLIGFEAHILPPRLKSLSHAVSELPSAMFHTLLRPSFSFPMSLNDSPTTARKNPKFSLSSLRAILYDELGVSLLMNFCVEDSSIEMLLFWLDVEHFKYFDGNEEDTKLFAHHIMLKYVGYYAELPIGLPKTLEDQIVDKIQVTPFNQEVFNEAQSYVYDIMEKSILVRFLQSKDGQTYLQALVDRDNDRRQKQREVTTTDSTSISASVVSFDKRHLQTKFYVYSIRVEMEDCTYMIYRRYSEFYALHQELRAAFRDIPIPPMPKKIFFGRSQTRSVAHQRLGDLNQFIQGVLTMSPVISSSSQVKQFLAQTQNDRDDEAFDNRIYS